MRKNRKTVLAQPISILGLSPHEESVIQKAGFKTVAGLTAHTVKKLLRYKNVGLGTVQSVRRGLKKFGLDLKGASAPSQRWKDFKISFMILSNDTMIADRVIHRFAKIIHYLDRASGTTMDPKIMRYFLVKVGYQLGLGAPEKDAEPFFRDLEAQLVRLRLLPPQV